MRRCMKSRSILAGLYVVTAMVVGVSEAEAAGTSITITGVYKPGGGDPPYDYIFNVYLNPPAVAGTNTFQMGDSFSIEGLAGVDDTSLYHTPLQWSLFALTPAMPPASAPFASNLTFEYSGSTVYSASNPIPGTSVFLGQFEVVSSYDFPNGVVPYPSGTTLSYTYTIGGVTTQGNGFQIFAVPEPSSALLFAVGSGILPVMWLLKRRRWHQEQWFC